MSLRTKDRRPLSGRMLIMADGCLDIFTAKTAVGLLRYRRDRVVAVLDRQHSGQDLGSLVSAGSGIPIVASVAEALALRPTTFVIGAATAGGRLPAGWRAEILAALQAGLDVVNGLHERLSGDVALLEAAGRSGARIIDIRRGEQDFPVAAGRALGTRAHRILTVGTDCNVGKMVVSLELVRELRDRGCEAEMVATGQTGVLIEGSGVCIDAVLSDFIAGAAESLVCERGDSELVVVEGQGSILHPSFSGVAVGLMHGVMPDSMILCHAVGRTSFRGTNMAIPPLEEVIALYEALMKPLHPSKVVGLALNCHGLSDKQAKQRVREVQREVQLPTTDCVRFGAGVLADAVTALAT